MRVVDDKLLSEFRHAPRCAWCNALTPGGTEPHHLWSRGLGGGGRLDVRVNIVSLCQRCHREHHNGHAPYRHQLLRVVAAREGKLPREVEAEVLALRRRTRL